MNAPRQLDNLETLRVQRDSVLAIHALEVGPDWGCDHTQHCRCCGVEYPCPTVEALGVTSDDVDTDDGLRFVAELDPNSPLRARIRLGEMPQISFGFFPEGRTRKARRLARIRRIRRQILHPHIRKGKTL